MQKVVRLIAILTAVLASAIINRAQVETKPSQAILTGLPDAVSVDVTLGKEFKTIAGPPTGALYSKDKDGNEVQVAPVPANVASPYRTFRIAFPSTTGTMSYSPDKKYEVLVFVPSVVDGAAVTMKKAISVTGLFTVEIRRVGSCEGLQMLIRSPLRNQQAIWKPVYDWLEQFGPNNASDIADIKIRVVDDPNERDYEVVPPLEWKKEPGFQAQAGALQVCMELNKPLPTKDFNAKFTFHGPNLPPQLTTAEGEEIGGAFAVDFPKDEEVAAPDDRALERNLDLGVTFTTQVADEVTPATATTPEVTERKRTSRGVVDLRFAPWMNVLDTVFEANAWVHYLTPIFINANVATGKIEEETLGLNRVLIGLEGESRYVHRRTFDITASGGTARRRVTYPYWHRLVWGLTHASDRDFKQKEFTGKIEYKPIIDKLYQPHALNYRFDKEGYKHQKWYGFTVLPEIGFEIGRTYSRRNPAPAVKPSDTVRRFYFGGELSLDLTEFVTLSAQDTFYVRGENPQDYFKNHFKGSGEFRLGRSRNRLFAHSLFLTFERGQKPPFASPDVNSFRIGYRLQGNYCGEKCR